jgi:desampylase
MEARIASAAAAAILARAAAASAHEVCGVLLGPAPAGAGAQVFVAEAVPAANVAADPALAFEVDPAVLLGLHRAARAGGAAVVGHYHSHPSGTAWPSPRDAAAAHGDGALWIIAADGRLAGFAARAGGPVHGAFDPVAIAVV